MASSTSADDNISGENEQHEQVQRQEKTPEYVYHTPQTYRLSRRRLRKSTTDNANDESETNQYDSHILPWEEASKGPQSLFKSAPPMIKYPTGITDPNQIRFYKIRIDGYLRSSPAVRQIIDGRRQHPFLKHTTLNDFAASKGIPNYVFDTAKTFTTIKWVEESDTTLASELKDLYNFGGIYSYSSINEQIYMTYFSTLNPNTSGGDLHIISSCEQYDGMTARKLILESLRTLRTGDISTTAYRHSKKISNARLPMRIGGAAAYFGVIDEHRSSLTNMNESLPDTEVVGRIFEATRGLHEEIDNTIRKLRRRAGKDNIPLTYKQVKHAIIDTFKYDIPDVDKTAPPNTPILATDRATSTIPTKPTTKREANMAGLHPTPDTKDGKSKTKRRKFEKGSCKHHPESTSHNTHMCYLTKREKKGLPAGKRWCTVHKQGVHYESDCYRHKRTANTAKVGWAMIPHQQHNPYAQHQIMPHGG